MKKLAILLLFVASLLPAQEIIDTNSVVIAWDPVTELADGTPVPVEDQISYRVYRAPKGDRETPEYIDQTESLQYTVTFLEEGIYELGVSAVRTTDIGQTESTIAWSEDYGFIIRYLRAPLPPEGLRSP
jgi:hypothetical protein